MTDRVSTAAGPGWHGTTVLAVRRGGHVVIAADGQVTAGNTVMKGTARKVRRLAKGAVLAGFAGATADAFALFERLETKLEQYPQQLTRACVEMAKDWRTDRYLRRLEAMMAVADRNVSLLLTGTGDVLEPDDGLIAIGSGGPYALAAARALIGRAADGGADGLDAPHLDAPPLDAETIARRALAIAADICIYTNHQITVESLETAAAATGLEKS